MTKLLRVDTSVRSSASVSRALAGTSPSATPADPAEEALPSEHLKVDVWADLACPWCYIGKKRLDGAIVCSPDPEAITVSIHSFELNPTMGSDARPNLEVLAASHHLPLAQARAMEERLAAVAQAEGLAFELDRVVANSFDVHRAVHLAGDHDLAYEMFGALQHELFAGAADAYDHTVIVDTGAQLGLPRARIEEVLASDEYADAVRADEAEAGRLGITGVPFVVLNGRAAIPGAASTDDYIEAIKQERGRR